MTATDDRASVAAMPQSRADRLSPEDRARGVQLAADLARLRAKCRRAEALLIEQRDAYITAMREQYGYRNLPSDVAEALDVDRSTVHAVIKTGSNRRTTPDRGEATS